MQFVYGAAIAVMEVANNKQLKKMEEASQFYKIETEKQLNSYSKKNTKLQDELNKLKEENFVRAVKRNVLLKKCVEKIN